MQAESGSVVRGRCACGRRYRIRNAVAGVHVQCPACGRTIAITHADLRASDDVLALAPLQDETGEMPEVILVSQGELQLAPGGSRPGLNGRLFHDSPESQVAQALTGRLAGLTPAPTEGGAALRSADDRPEHRRFAEDIVATFHLGGYTSNLANLMATTVVCGLLGAIALSAMRIGLLTWISLILYGLILMTMFHFFSTVLHESAQGRRELAWLASDWDFVDDVVRPALTMIGASILCSLPAWIVWWTAPDAVARFPAIYWAALATGWFFWPAVVMSVLLGGGVGCLRPDLLVRTVTACDWAYPLVWLLLVGVGVGWRMAGELVSAAQLPSLVVAAAGPLITLYFGYVVFRILGLTYFHYRARMPW